MPHRIRPDDSQRQPWQPPGRILAVKKPELPEYGRHVFLDPVRGFKEVFTQHGKKLGR
jgi:hypothetical protein